MQSQLTAYILNYGYVVLFAIVLIQELGVLGLPNELVLLYIGFATYQHQLLFPGVLGLVVLADVTAACLVFFLFYYAGNGLRAIKAGWMQKLFLKSDKWKERIGNRRAASLLAGKLTPFIRGYVPVAAGLMQVQPFLYIWVVTLSALIWTGGWVTAGWLLAGN